MKRKLTYIFTILILTAVSAQAQDVKAHFDAAVIESVGGYLSEESSGDITYIVPGKNRDLYSIIASTNELVNSFNDIRYVNPWQHYTDDFYLCIILVIDTEILVGINNKNSTPIIVVASYLGEI